jgi:hypothetical protein
MKHLSVLIASTLFLGLAGCATVQSPVNGVFYTDVKSGVMATEAYGGSAHGEACATSILGIFASGDASIDAAKKSGNIAQVTVIDHSANNILGLYAKYCTIVYGKKSSSGGSAAPAAKPAG